MESRNPRALVASTLPSSTADQLGSAIKKIDKMKMLSAINAATILNIFKKPTNPRIQHKAALRERKVSTMLLLIPFLLRIFSKSAREFWLDPNLAPYIQQN